MIVSIPQSFIQELLSRVDIVEVVGRYVTLKKGGVNFMGLCPFHGEKSPSFSVSPSKQFFHCFGCGKHGNAVGFLMEHTGIGFVEAVKDLAQQAGLSVPEEDLSPQERIRAAEQRKRQHSLTDVLQTAAAGYAQELKQSPKAIDYLKRRGLTGRIAKTFQLGYAPAGWRFLSTVFPDYQSPLLTESGLVIASDEPEPSPSDAHGSEKGGSTAKRYDRFRDRIIFPIRNVKGEHIGFGGRVIDQGEPKYLNSPETPVFSKGHELYGLFEARSAIRQAGYVLVTEGYMDVVALAQHGFGQTVATLGTACTPDHVRLLFRFSEAVVFSFDGDAAGRRAARKALEAALPWATDTRSIKFLFLPPEHDPDSFIREQGQAAFAQCVEQASPLSRFLLETVSQGHAMDTAEGRARTANLAGPLWTLLPDGALKRQLLHELADLVGLDTPELEAVWHASGRYRQTQRTNTSQPGVAQTRPSRQPPIGIVAGAAQPLPTTQISNSSDKQPGAKSRGKPSAGKRPRTARGWLDNPDRVARIVLSTPQAWDWLTDHDHQLLAGLPEPHGPMFGWLERQWHEHGPQPWAALREGLRELPFEALATALQDSGILLEQAETQDSNAALPPADAQRELLELLRRLHIERLKQEETQLIAQAEHDAQVLLRYRQVQDERKRLEAAARTV